MKTSVLAVVCAAVLLQSVSFAGAQEGGSGSFLRLSLPSPILLGSGSGSSGGGEGAPPDGTPNNPTELTLVADPGTWRVGDPIAFQLDISGGSGDYTVVTDLPGLAYGAGWLSGNLGAGPGPDYSVAFTVSAEDTLAAGLSGSSALGIVVLPQLVVTTPSGLSGSEVEPFSYVAAATGVVGTPTWSITGDLAGTGLTFDPASRTISGYPTEPVTGITLTVEDSRDGRSASSLPFDIALTQPTYRATVSGNVTDLDPSELFTPEQWSSSFAKEVTVSAGAVVSASSTVTPAIDVPAFGGTLSILNAGAIQGFGGSGGILASGNPGGPAIDANGHAISIVNSGTIYGGGGGGGGGGKGATAVGATSVGTHVSGASCTYNRPNGTTIQNISISFNGAFQTSTSRTSSTSSFTHRTANYEFKCEAAGSANIVTRAGTRAPLTTTTYPGGNGGTGGKGTGPASAGIGVNGQSGTGGSGSGGKGGNGGGWGQAGFAGAQGNNSTQGSTGSTPGYPGGASGPAIRGAANVTLTNTGQVLGGVTN